MNENLKSIKQCLSVNIKLIRLYKYEIIILPGSDGKLTVSFASSDLPTWLAFPSIVDRIPVLK